MLLPLALSLAVGPRAGMPAVYGQAAHAGVPAAALALAHRLGVRGTPVVGAQPHGRGGPWTVWLTRIIKPGWVGPAGIPRRYLQPIGRALSAGPTGASGEFHYYDFTVLSPTGVLSVTGGDRYHGPPIPPRRAIQIGRQWLRRAGAPTPAGPLHVQVRRGMTDIGGTGLCCFTTLAVLWWGGTMDQYGFVHHASAIVYVADAGTVVQADVTPHGPTTNWSSTPCRAHPHRDRNGVALGAWCFDYPAAADRMFIGEVGDHGPWVDDPRQFAGGFTYGSKIAGRTGTWGPLLLTRTNAVRRISYDGAAYRLTLMPAFPGLDGSIWELVTVERA